MSRLRILGIGVAFLAFLSFVLTAMPRFLDPTEHKPEKQRADQQWVNTSPYWLDRQACRWLSLCGVHHVRFDPATRPGRKGAGDDNDELRRELRRSLQQQKLDTEGETYSERSWENAARRPRRKSGHEQPPATGTTPRQLKKIPQFVLDHAPLVHLSSDEHFWPADIAEHVRHMTAHVDSSAGDAADDEPAANLTEPLGLDNLHLLNRLRAPGREVFLQSNDDVEARPEWLYSDVGIPMPFDDDFGDGDGDGEEEPRQEADEEAGRGLGEGTSWYDVGRDHPLHRISAPRRFSPKTRSRLVQKLLMDRPPDLPKARGERRRRAVGPEPEQQQQQQPTARVHYKPDAEGFSKGPAVLVVVDKGDGIVDAFWFFFYAYNLGQTVWGLRYGNHVGDWEHCLVRFEDGVPRGIFFSEHEGGQAYAFGAVEHRGGRPVIYSAVGSHAMYPMPGIHPYVLPFHMLRDVTDRGPLWDPAKNIYAYHYDPSLEPRPVRPRAATGLATAEAEEDFEEPAVKGMDVADEDDDEYEEPQSLTPAAENPDAPTSWFHYAGCWGDRLYRLSDPRQYRLFQQYHYVEGPLGPKFKRLDREKICQNNRCRILYSLNPGETWYG